MAAPKKKRPATKPKRSPAKPKANPEAAAKPKAKNKPPSGHSTKSKKPDDKRRRKGPARGKARKVTAKTKAARESAKDSLMLAETIRGIPLKEIARTHKLRPEVVKARVQEKRENLPRLYDMDAADIIEAFVQELQVSIGDFEMIALAALEGNNLGVAVAAKDRGNKAREQLKELLQSVGKLPNDLGTLTWVIDIRAVVTEINAAVMVFAEGVAAMSLPEENRQEVLEAAAKVTGRLDEIAQSPQSVEPLPDPGDDKGGLDMDGGDHERESGELKEGDRISEEEIAKGGHNLDERVREGETPAEAEKRDGGE